MSQFTVTGLSLTGLKLVERQRLGDIRGFLSCLFCPTELAAAVLGRLAYDFKALTEDLELLYCHSGVYNASAEASLNPQDARLAINWPLPVTKLSTRDAGHALIKTELKGVSL